MLVAKLYFLKHVMSKETDDLCGRIVLSLCDDFDSPCMVRECRELEEPFGTDFTADIIHNKELSLKIVKKILYEEDKNARLEKCRDKAPFIAAVAEDIGWNKLWDMSTDQGWKAVMGLQMLSRALGHHGHGNHPYHLCPSHMVGRLQTSLLNHILDAHWKELHMPSEINRDRLLEILSDHSLEVLSKFKNIFKCF